jgi:hypothetical protein
MREALPKASQEDCALASDLIMTTLSAAGKLFSETPRNPAEIEAFADATSDMFSAYLEHLARG